MFSFELNKPIVMVSLRHIIFFYNLKKNTIINWKEFEKLLGQIPLWDGVTDFTIELLFDAPPICHRPHVMPLQPLYFSNNFFFCLSIFYKIKESLLWHFNKGTKYI